MLHTCFTILTSGTCRWGDSTSPSLVEIGARRGEINLLEQEAISSSSIACMVDTGGFEPSARMSQTCSRLRGRIASRDFVGAIRLPRFACGCGPVCCSPPWHRLTGGATRCLWARPTGHVTSPASSQKQLCWRSMHHGGWGGGPTNSHLLHGKSLV